MLPMSLDSFVPYVFGLYSLGRLTIVEPVERAKDCSLRSLSLDSLAG
jgi:hypothetical protein